MTVMAGVGAFALGRLAVWTNQRKGILVRGVLYLVVGILAVPISIGPVVAVGFAYFEDLQHFEDFSPDDLTQFLIVLSWLVYYAVRYLSFRMGTGRVSGMG